MSRAFAFATLVFSLSLALAACATGPAPTLPSSGNPYGTSSTPVPPNTD